MPPTLEPVPADLEPQYLWRRSVTLPAPTLGADGRVDPDVWQPTSRTEEVWGRLAIFLNDTDITFVNGRETIVDKLSWEKPLWWLEAEIRIQGVGPHQAAADALPSLLADEMYNKLEVWRVLVDVVDGVPDPDTEVLDSSVLWAGFRNAWRTRGNQLVMGCKGRFRKTDDAVRAPSTGPTPAADISVLISTQLNPAFFELHHNILTEPVGGTGILIPYRGGWEESKVDYIKLHLANAYDLAGSGRRWTVLRGADDLTPELRLDRFGQAVDFSHAYDYASVAPDLAHEDDMVGNVGYTETTDAAGTRDRGLRYTDDATPILVHNPAAYEEDVHAADDNGDGTLTSHNDRLVAGKHRREIYVAGGQGYDRPEMTRVLGEQITRDTDAGWVGDSFVMSLDPQQMSRLDIRPDMNGELKYFHGIDLKYHVIGNEWQRAQQGAYDVRCTVDTNARDVRQVDAILKRNKELATNPTRALRGGQASVQNLDDKFPWDPVRSGIYPLERAFPPYSAVAAAADGTWTLFTFVGAERAWIQTVLLVCADLREFSFSIYLARESQTLGDLLALLPTDPLADGAWDDLDAEAKQIYLAGTFGQPAGYSPKVRYVAGVDTGISATGVLIDQGGFGFTHDDVDPDDRRPQELVGALWIPAGAGDTTFHMQLSLGPSGA